MTSNAAFNGGIKKNTTDGRMNLNDLPPVYTTGAHGAYNMSASPLLLGEPKKSNLVAPYSNHQLAKIKETSFNSNILSNIDTDYL